MSRGPNILWIQTDEHRPDSLGCYGSAWAKTPNLDLLAAHGVVMRNCFCQSPVCTPSRSSQLTCLYPQECNVVFNNEVAWRPDIFPKGTWTFPEAFAEAGYETASIGKWHTPIHPTWQIAEQEKLIRKYADFTDMGPGYSDKKYHVVKRPGLHRIIIAGTYPSFEENPSRISTDRAIEFLRERKADRPFLLRVSHNWPHTPVLPPPPFDRTYDADEIPVQFYDHEAYSRRAQYDRTLADAQRMRELTREEMRQSWKDYMGLVSYVDYEVGRLLAALKAFGLERDTIVMFSSDHGRALGEFGHGEKCSFDEQVWRVPLIFSWPGHVPEGEVRGDLCELVDTGRTLLGLAGLRDRAPPFWRGIDLFAPQTAKREAVFGQLGWPNRKSPLLTSEPVVKIRAALAETMKMDLDQAYPTFGLMRVAVHTRRYRMDVSWMQDGKRFGRELQDGNLIDLESDPQEKNNLWHDPAHRDVVGDLLARLEAWFEQMDKPELIFGRIG